MVISLESKSYIGIWKENREVQLKLTTVPEMNNLKSTILQSNTLHAAPILNNDTIEKM